MRYVADDGTEFRTEKECLEYENDQKKVLEYFIWYDKDYEKTENFNFATYMNILNNVEDVVDYLRYEYGCDDGIKGCGFYMWNDNGEWEFIDDVINHYTQKLELLKNIKYNLEHSQ